MGNRFNKPESDELLALTNGPTVDAHPDQNDVKLPTNVRAAYNQTIGHSVQVMQLSFAQLIAAHRATQPFGKFKNILDNKDAADDLRRILPADLMKWMALASQIPDAFRSLSALESQYHAQFEHADSSPSANAADVRDSTARIETFSNDVFMLAAALQFEANYGKRYSSNNNNSDAREQTPTTPSSLPTAAREVRSSASPLSLAQTPLHNRVDPHQRRPTQTDGYASEPECASVLDRAARGQKRYHPATSDYGETPLPGSKRPLVEEEAAAMATTSDDPCDSDQEQRLMNVARFRSGHQARLK
jgi:hypothetical protein